MSRILVVDDEVRITNFVSRALSAEGFAVETAWNGTDGLKLARSGQYDLVVVSEFPDDETATAFLLQVGGIGNVRTSTLRAFDRQAFAKIVEKAG